MKLMRVELSKKSLLALPEDERVLFISLGQLANEINALSKMAFWSSSGNFQETSPEYHGQLTNILLFIRLLAGKLNEGWQLLGKHFFATKLSKKYEPLIDKKSI